VLANNPDVQPFDPRFFFSTTDVVDLPTDEDARAPIIRDMMHAAVKENLPDKIVVGQTGSRWDLLAGVIVSPSQVRPRGVRVAPRGDLLATAQGMGRVRCSFPQPLFPGGIGSRDVELPSHSSEITSTVAPAGQVTIVHFDYYGGSTLVCHVEGQKLWIAFPMTAHNLQVMTSTVDWTMFRMEAKDLVSIFSKVEQISIAVIDTRVGFVLSPYTFHAVISLTPSFHVGGPVFFPEDTVEALRAQDQFLRAALRRFQQDGASDEDVRRLAQSIDANTEYVMRVTPAKDKEAAAVHRDRLSTFLEPALTKRLVRK
jgi:hypothetical protein